MVSCAIPVLLSTASETSLQRKRRPGVSKIVGKVRSRIILQKMKKFFKVSVTSFNDDVVVRELDLDNFEIVSVEEFTDHNSYIKYFMVLSV